MVCPYCHNDTSVSNSRPQKSRNQTWRRRLCKACGAVFTTIEAIDLSQTLSVQQTGAHTLAPFDRDKLFISLYKSLQHRPAASSDGRALADTVIAHIFLQVEHGRVSTRTIAEICLNTLRHFDEAAATHYAAFHPIEVADA